MFTLSILELDVMFLFISTLMFNSDFIFWLLGIDR
jgi:hypothetical protein